MSENKKYKIKDKKEENSEITITVEVEKDFVAKFREKAIKNVGREIEIKGFRKGMAPEKMIVGVVGEMKIAEEQAYQALYEILPIIVSQEKIDALTTPKVSITKISPADNLEFKAVFTLMPKIELADYKKIAKSSAPEKKIDVTDKEINDYINYIRKNRAEAEALKQKTSGKKTDAIGGDATTEKADATKKTDGGEKADVTKKTDGGEKENLPEFNDEFVKTLGAFKDVEDFKSQLQQNMQTEKDAKEKNRRRTEIIEKIIAESKIDLPEILIDEEKERMIRQYQADIEKIGIKFEDYLKEIKKTPEDLKKDWHVDAVKRAKMNLILPKIAVAEQISPDKERLEHEMKHIVEHHKEIDEHTARLYLSHVLTNEKVFEFLENIK